MFEFILSTLKDFADGVITNFEKDKPEIEIFGGALGLAVAGIAACVATSKAKDKIAEVKEDLNDIEEQVKEGKTDEETARKIKAKICLKGVGYIVIGYLGPVAIAIISGKLIVCGVNEERFRISTLETALAAETARADKLLSRAVAAYGPEAKDKLLYDIHKVEEEKEEVNPETGEKETKKAEKLVAGEDISQGYRFRINEYTCPSWFMPNSREYNLSQLRIFLSEIQKDIFRKHGAYGGYIMTAYDIMHQLGYRPCEDDEWRIKYKDVGVNSTPENPFELSFGLTEAEKLLNLGIDDDIILHINFIPNVWTKRK